MERRGLVALVAGAVGIAFAPIFVRWSELPPTATAFYRLALAAPFLWAWARVAGGPKPAGARDWARLSLPGLLFAGDLGVWHWSIRFTTVANATLLANFAPVFVTLGGWLVFRRRFTRLFLAGMTAAIAGAAMLVADSSEAGRRYVLGDALGLLTAGFYGCYILSVGHLRERFSTVTILAWTVTSGALVLLPVCLAAGESLVPLTLRGWAVLLALALVSQIGGQGLIAYALAHLPAAFSSVTLLLQPAAVVYLGWVFFGEAFGGWQAVGACVIVTGILLARRGSRHSGGGGLRSSSRSTASGVPGSGSSQ